MTIKITDETIKANTNAAVLDEAIASCLETIRAIDLYKTELQSKHQDLMASLVHLQALRILLKTTHGV